jgi:hypothetical protein
MNLYIQTCSGDLFCRLSGSDYGFSIQQLQSKPFLPGETDVKKLDKKSKRKGEVSMAANKILIFF